MEKKRINIEAMRIDNFDDHEDMDKKQFVIDRDIANDFHMYMNRGKEFYERQVANFSIQVKAIDEWYASHSKWLIDTPFEVFVIVVAAEVANEISSATMPRLDAISRYRAMLAAGADAYEGGNWVDDQRDLLEKIMGGADVDMATGMTTALKTMEASLQGLVPPRVFTEKVFVAMINELTTSRPFFDVESVMSALDADDFGRGVRDNIYQLVALLLADYSGLPFQRLFSKTLAWTGVDVESLRTDAPSLAALNITHKNLRRTVANMINRSSTRFDVDIIPELIKKTRLEYVAFVYIRKMLYGALGNVDRDESAVDDNDGSGVNNKKSEVLANGEAIHPDDDAMDDESNVWGKHRHLGNFLVTFEAITNVNLLDVLYFTNKATFERVVNDMVQYYIKDIETAPAPEDDDANEEEFIVDDDSGDDSVESIDSEPNTDDVDLIEDEGFHKREKERDAVRAIRYARREKTSEEKERIAAQRRTRALETTTDNRDTVKAKSVRIHHFESVMRHRGVDLKQHSSSRAFFINNSHFVLGRVPEERVESFDILANLVAIHLVRAGKQVNPEKVFETCDRLLTGEKTPTLDLALLEQYLDIFETHGNIIWTPDPIRFEPAFHVYRIFYLGYYAAGFGYDCKPGTLLDPADNNKELRDLFEIYGQMRIVPSKEIYRGSISSGDLATRPNLTAAEQYWYLLGDENRAYVEAMTAHLQTHDNVLFHKEKAWWYAGTGRYPFWKSPLTTFRLLERGLDFENVPSSGASAAAAIDVDDAPPPSQIKKATSPEGFLKTTWDIVNSRIDWILHGIPAGHQKKIDAIAKHGVCENSHAEEDDVDRIARLLEENVYTLNPDASATQHATFKQMLENVLVEVDDPNTRADFVKHRAGIPHGQHFNFFGNYLTFALAAAYNVGWKLGIPPIVFSDLMAISDDDDDDDDDETPKGAMKRNRSSESSGSENEKGAARAKKPRK